MGVKRFLSLIQANAFMATKKLRALLLLSGGIDSPVAGWLARQGGLEVDCIHFGNEVFAGTEPEYKSKVLARRLGFRKFFFGDLSGLLSKLASGTQRRYYFVLMKRAMHRIAERVARAHGYDVLVTGESLGQVSSQTLTNLSVVHTAVEIPVLRPLLCLDKVEIIRLATEIGTYEVSKGKEHCDALGPEKPSTQAGKEVILAEEKNVGLAALVEQAAAQVREEDVATMKLPEAPKHLQGVC